MFEILPRTDGSYVGVRLIGALTGEDVRALAAYLRRVADERGPLRVLFAASEWTGWASWGALWADATAEVQLSDHVAKLAMAGKGIVDDSMTQALKPFVHARVRWFPSAELEDAWRWLVDGNGADLEGG